MNKHFKKNTTEATLQGLHVQIYDFLMVYFNNENLLTSKRNQIQFNEY